MKKTLEFDANDDTEIIYRWSVMASITIRKLEDTVKMKLKNRAAANGQSMEEEARQILRSTLDQVPVSSVHNADSTSSAVPLQARLIELEDQGIWISAKDPDTRITLGDPAPGALERFLVDR